MQMTNAERLLGVMLAEIMEGMGLNRDIDPTFVKKVLINHDEWALSWKYGFFHDEAPVEQDDVRETGDILSMMSYIEHSVQLLAETNPEFADEHALRFSGFDGNNDRHHGIAHTIVHDLNRFSEFQDRDLNSHSMGSLPMYRRIKPAYDAAVRGTLGRGLSADDLRTIVAAAHY